MSFLSKKEQRQLAAEIRKLIGKNYTDDEICEKLNIRPNLLVEYKRRIYQHDKVRFQGMDKYVVFSDYVSKSSQMVKELDEVKLKFRNRGQWSALVSAIKAKKEIYDSVIKMGQEFGLIDRRAAEVKVQGEVSFSTMSDADVRREIESEVKRLNEIAQGGVVDMRPELMGVTDDNVEHFVPANIVSLPAPKTKTKKTTKVRVTLKKRI